MVAQEAPAAANWYRTRLFVVPQLHSSVLPLLTSSAWPKSSMASAAHDTTELKAKYRDAMCINPKLIIQTCEKEVGLSIQQRVFRNISIHLAIFRLACARAAMRCLSAAPSVLRTYCAVLIPDGTRSRTVRVHERRTVPTLGGRSGKPIAQANIHLELPEFDPKNLPEWAEEFADFLLLTGHSHVDVATKCSLLKRSCKKKFLHKHVNEIVKTSSTWVEVAPKTGEDFPRL